MTQAQAPKEIPPPPSSWMEDAFSCGGGLVGTCHCGRTHFEDREDAGDWGEGELIALRAQHTANPDKVHADGYRYAQIDGRMFVVGCPCNGLRRYEDFLWQHRRRIASYLAVRAADAKRAADLDDAIAADLPGAVKYV